MLINGQRALVGGIGFLADGSAARPSLAFASEPGTGFYKIGIGIAGFVSVGLLIFQYDTGDVYSGDTTAGSFQIRRDAGTAATPTYTFRSDPDTGMFRSAANGIGFSSNGALVVTISGQTIRCAGNTAITAGGVQDAGIVFGTTNNIGIFFGSGAPTMAANQGSLYLRSDGSSTVTRLYVNTTGAAVWTPVTTSA